jgi:hypothetical protein
MSEIKPKFQKMKFTGYACIIFAALLTIMIVFGITDEERVQVTVSLIGTWLLTGTGLLTANAAKRISAQAVVNKHDEAMK